MVIFYIQSLVGIVYSWDYDGIWSSSIPQLSFLINENIFVECFRFCLSFIGHWISPLSIKYKPPHLFLFFANFIWTLSFFHIIKGRILNFLSLFIILFVQIRLKILFYNYIAVLKWKLYILFINTLLLI